MRREAMCAICNSVYLILVNIFLQMNNNNISISFKHFLSSILKSQSAINTYQTNKHYKHLTGQELELKIIVDINPKTVITWEEDNIEYIALMRVEGGNNAFVSFILRVFISLLCLLISFMLILLLL